MDSVGELINTNQIKEPGEDDNEVFTCFETGDEICTFFSTGDDDEVFTYFEQSSPPPPSPSPPPPKLGEELMISLY